MGVYLDIANAVARRRDRERALLAAMGLASNQVRTLEPPPCVRCHSFIGKASIVVGVCLFCGMPIRGKCQ
jgi:hypothetical protein